MQIAEPQARRKAPQPGATARRAVDASRAGRAQAGAGRRKPASTVRAVKAAPELQAAAAPRPPDGEATPNRIPFQTGMCRTRNARYTSPGARCILPDEAANHPGPRPARRHPRKQRMANLRLTPRPAPVAPNSAEPLAPTLHIRNKKNRIRQALEDEKLMVNTQVNPDKYFSLLSHLLTR